MRAVRKYNLAICHHNFRAEQIIERQTESRQKRAVAAPGQQSGQANCAGYSGYCGKPMWARGSENVDSPCATCDCGNSASNVHLDLPHPREIYYQPMVPQRPSCPIMPPTAHGQRKTIRSSSTHRLLHISRALTEGKQRWPASNCAVENLPGPLVGSLTCDCNLACITVRKSSATVVPNLFVVSVVIIVCQSPFWFCNSIDYSAYDTRARVVLPGRTFLASYDDSRPTLTRFSRV